MTSSENAPKTSSVVAFPRKVNHDDVVESLEQLLRDIKEAPEKVRTVISISVINDDDALWRVISNVHGEDMHLPEFVGTLQMVATRLSVFGDYDEED